MLTADMSERRPLWHRNYHGLLQRCAPVLEFGDLVDGPMRTKYEIATFLSAVRGGDTLPVLV